MNTAAKFVRSIVCTLLVAVASATTADAQELSAKDRVINLLSAYETTFNQADFVSAAPNAEALLVEILEDNSAWLFVRARALSALTLFANDTNLRRTIAMLTHDNPLLRQYATMHLARTYGKTHPQAVLPPLAKALSDDDIMVRRYAIRAVGGLRMPGAREALATRLAVEPRPDVTRLIQKQLDHHTIR